MGEAERGAERIRVGMFVRQQEQTLGAHDELPRGGGTLIVDAGRQ